ncbi:MAG: type II toxin-antitoxin system PemK/MazF family toxin [Waterburya sp.]
MLGGIINLCTQILQQYKKTKYFEVGNQFNALFPLSFPLYPPGTDKLHIRCKISVIYVPLTTQNRRSKYEVELPKLKFLNRDSFANVQGLGSIPRVRLERKLGQLPDETMHRIKQAISFALDLELDS